MAVRPVLLVIVAVLALACGSSEHNGISISVSTPEPAVAPAEPSAMTPATTSRTPTPGALVATQVIDLDSLSPSAVTSEGGCIGPSEVRRPGAWRCDDRVLGPGDRPVDAHRDPCFGPYNTNLMVCVRGPSRGFEVTTMRLTRPLPTVLPFPAGARVPPLWVETSDGRVCGYKFRGTSPVVNGLRLNYYCADDTGLIGHAQEGQIWTARQVKVGPDLLLPNATAQETIVELRTVWR